MTFANRDGQLWLLPPGPSGPKTSEFLQSIQAETNRVNEDRQAQWKARTEEDERESEKLVPGILEKAKDKIQMAASNGRTSEYIGYFDLFSSHIARDDRDERVRQWAVGKAFRKLREMGFTIRDPGGVSVMSPVGKVVEWKER